MSRRLVDLYPVGEAVQIRLPVAADGGWQAGQIIAHDYPGVWVKTVNGRAWYVTNGRRIRRLAANDADDEPLLSIRPEIASQLRQLNRVFYDQFAIPFAESRSDYPPGYEELLQRLHLPVANLLDVGCGQGRFGQFLGERGALGCYVGVDFSAGLLAEARQRLPAGEYVECDLAAPDCLDGLGEFDLIACLSVLQHIPGRHRRQRLLQEMGEHLKEGGRLALATWQFLDSPRQRAKIVPWETIGLRAADMERGDYLLTWRRGGLGYRYVAHIDLPEVEQLAAATGLQVEHHFRQDGHEGDLNLYAILARP